MGTYVSFQEGIVKSICHVYKNKDGNILHLLPIIHIGESEYFNEIMEYVGDKLCLYEDLRYGKELSKNELENYINPTNLDEWIARSEEGVDKMDKEYGPEIKKYLKKVLKGDVRKFRKAIVDNLGNVNERISIIFDQVERTAFSLAIMPILQSALRNNSGNLLPNTERDKIPNKKFQICHLVLIILPL